MTRDADEMAFDLFYSRTDAAGVEIVPPMNEQTGGGVMIVGKPCKTSAELEARARWMLEHPIEPVFEELSEEVPQ